VPALPRRRRADAQRMANLGRFIGLCAQTTIRTKRRFLEKTRLAAAHEQSEAEGTIRALRAIATEGIENARSAIPLVREDSRLGWEPSMEYLCDEDHLTWKIRQVTHVLERELPEYEASLAYNLGS